MIAPMSQRSNSLWPSFKKDEGKLDSAVLKELVEQHKKLAETVDQLVMSDAISKLDSKLDDAFPLNSVIEQKMLIWRKFLGRVGVAYERAFDTLTGVISRQNHGRESLALNLSTGAINASIASLLGPVGPFMAVIINETRENTVDFFATEEQRLFNQQKSQVKSLMTRLLKTKVFSSFLVNSGVGANDAPNVVQLKLNEAGIQMERAIWEYLADIKSDYRTRKSILELKEEAHKETGLGGLDLVARLEKDCLEKIRMVVDELMEDLDFPGEYSKFIDSEDGLKLLQQDMEKRMWAEWVVKTNIGDPCKVLGTPLSFMHLKPGRLVLERLHKLKIVDLEPRVPECVRFCEDYKKGAYGPNMEAKKNGRHFEAFYSSYGPLKNLRKWAEETLEEKPNYVNAIPHIESVPNAIPV